MSDIENDHTKEPGEYEPPRIEESAKFEALSLSCGLNLGQGGNCDELAAGPVDNS